MEEIESNISESGKSDVIFPPTENSSQESDKNPHNSPFYRSQKNKKPVFDEVDPAEQEVI